MGILKRLMHLFVILIVLSFSAMIYILIFGDDTPDKYEVRTNYKESISSLVSSDSMKMFAQLFDSQFGGGLNLTGTLN